MDVKVGKVENNQVKIEIIIDAQKFEEGMQKAFFRNAKRFNVPGFRKGKAPRKIVERYYGEEVLYDDAFEIVGTEAYEAVVKENSFEAVDRPQIEIVQIGSGKNMIFTAAVTVKPEVRLKDCRSIEVKKNEYNVTDDEVAKALDELRDKNARILSVDNRPLQQTDTAVIDFQGFIDGKPFKGGLGTKFSLAIGSSRFIPGFEEKLIGMNINEEREIGVRFPDEYFVKDLAGKDASFKVLLHEIKAKQLPEADDEFAKDVSEFSSLEDLKKDIHEKLTKAAQERTQRELEEEVIKKVVEAAEVDIPQVMIEHQIDSYIRDLEWRLSLRRLTLDDYLLSSEMDFAKLREEYAADAKEAVKTRLVLETVCRQEKIETSQEEIDKRTEEIYKNYGQDIEEVKKHLQEEDIEYIQDQLKLTKAVKFLADNAKIKQ